MLNSNTQAVTLTYDEIIFQSRNRAYGAFTLRQHYRPTLALGLGVGLFWAGLCAPTLYNWIWPTNRLANQSIVVQADLISLTEPPAELPLPPIEQAPVVNTVRNLPLIVMPEADVALDALPPTTDELLEATSGPQTAEGTGDVDIVAPPGASASTADEKALEIAPRTEDVFVAVEQEPQYPGGLDALRTFLSRSLNYPRAAASAGISGKIFLSFVVNTDGSLTDVQVLKGIGFGCDEEAIRVIRKMPNWRPGKQSGRAVRVKYNLPISFTLE